MNTAPNNKILLLKNVSKTFAHGTVDEVIALSGIRFEVCDQDFVTIIGSNGAGKSTLLNIIAGVYPPEGKGRVVIRGEDVTNQTGYQRATYKLTIEENLSLAVLRGQSRGLKRALSKQRRQLFREELAVLGLGLEDRLRTPVSTLSGGQRQALALIMATISKPAILLLDEHIATLDPKTAKIVLELTNKIVQRERMTTVMVTHNMEIALNHGNRLTMMHKGRIIVDKSEAEKKTLQVSDLVTAFERAAGEEFNDDSILLSNKE